MKSINKIILTVSLCYFGQNALAAAVTQEQKIAAAVDTYIQPVIKQCRIPGMAVAVTFTEKIISLITAYYHDNPKSQ
ncbi:hypothetical protein [Coxiella burnetii]|uniref:hypothetical protein n=1 Tax=Coxiella burnetii TaxID=777 RepID=UPI0000DAEC09|nr:hypothetical protein [Coxiella burnetii]ARI65567.1 hypothetical protein B7L74_03675 [Coxiella burnetii]MCF2094771.1 hypothetical protein [Coxiella burnetii]MCF2096807.1 hypothetical protein [Coxiella burnetii]MCF2098845.1 hypothetical protein [Coxiella burnetii]MCF2100877.1 hypothetical protein [Coxiella burnetii]